MTERRTIVAGAFVLGAVGMGLLISVDWKIGLGVFLFGWALTFENKTGRV